MAAAGLSIESSDTREPSPSPSARPGPDPLCYGHHSVTQEHLLLPKCPPRSLGPPPTPVKKGQDEGESQALV